MEMHCVGRGVLVERNDGVFDEFFTRERGREGEHVNKSE